MKTTIDIPEKGLSDAIHFTRAKTKLMAYNPYQNGKCEAWWNALERRLMTMLEGVGGAVPKSPAGEMRPPCLPQPRCRRPAAQFACSARDWTTFRRIAGRSIRCSSTTPYSRT